MAVFTLFGKGIFHSICVTFHPPSSGERKWKWDKTKKQRTESNKNVPSLSDTACKESASSHSVYVFLYISIETRFISFNIPRFPFPLYLWQWGCCIRCATVNRDETLLSLDCLFLSANTSKAITREGKTNLFLQPLNWEKSFFTLLITHREGAGGRFETSTDVYRYNVLQINNFRSLADIRIEICEVDRVRHCKLCEFVVETVECW